jgi:hypothetical protein
MQGEVTSRGEIVKLPGFTVNKEGEVTDVFTSDKLLPGVKNHRSESSSISGETSARNETTETSIDSLGN